MLHAQSCKATILETQIIYNRCRHDGRLFFCTKKKAKSALIPRICQSSLWIWDVRQSLYSREVTLAGPWNEDINVGYCDLMLCTFCTLIGTLLCGNVQYWSQFHQAFVALTLPQKSTCLKCGYRNTALNFLHAKLLSRWKLNWKTKMNLQLFVL